MPRSPAGISMRRPCAGSPSASASLRLRATSRKRSPRSSTGSPRRLPRARTWRLRPPPRSHRCSTPSSPPCRRPTALGSGASTPPTTAPAPRSRACANGSGRPRTRRPNGSCARSARPIWRRGCCGTFASSSRALPRPRRSSAAAGLGGIRRREPQPEGILLLDEPEGEVTHEPAAEQAHGVVAHRPQARGGEGGEPGELLGEVLHDAHRVAATGLVAGECRGEVARAGELPGEDGRVAERAAGALAEVGRHGVGGVAEEDQAAVAPTGAVDADHLGEHQVLDASDPGKHLAGEGKRARPGSAKARRVAVRERRAQCRRVGGGIEVRAAVDRRDPEDAERGPVLGEPLEPQRRAQAAGVAVRAAHARVEAPVLADAGVRAVGADDEIRGERSRAGRRPVGDLASGGRGEARHGHVEDRYAGGVGDAQPLDSRPAPQEPLVEVEAVEHGEAVRLEQHARADGPRRGLRLEQRHPGPRTREQQRGGQPSDAAAHDHDVPVVHGGLIASSRGSGKPGPAVDSASPRALLCGMDDTTESRALRTLREIVESGRPRVYLRSAEEGRVLALLREVAATLFSPPAPLWLWSLTQGMRRDGDGDGGGEPLGPRAALDFVAAHAGPGVFLFADFHDPMREAAEVRRRLRDLYAACLDRRKLLVVCSPVKLVPEELERQMVYVELAVPDLPELIAHLRQTAPGLAAAGAAVDASEATLFQLARALQGLTLDEVHHALRRAIAARNALDAASAPALLEEKRVLVKRTGTIEYIPTDVDLDQIGGLELMKKWLRARRKLFAMRDRLSAEIVPKGVLVMGISGCGKSLCIKAIASCFELPLYRIDMIEVFSGQHGPPEGAFAKACHMLESMAPAVVWFDEIEAAINAQAKEGELGRIFGFFLTWMQEKTRGLFVGATANRIDLLPAEMIRKGRFDEVFFVDLPLDDERIEIFRVHLRRRGIDPSGFNLEPLKKFTRGWTGAEIEQCVVASLTAARLAERDLTVEDLLNATANVVPLSKTMKEQVDHIRNWAYDRAVRASPREFSR